MLRSLMIRDINLQKVENMNEEQNLQNTEAMQYDTVLAAGLVIKSGNFKLKKKIENLNEFWDVINSSKSLYARHRMYASAFFFSWQIKEINKWLQRGWFWIAEPCS